MCKDCKHYHNSNGSEECSQEFIMSLDEMSRYFVDEEEGCPYSEL
jgi:hypothetical protein